MYEDTIKLTKTTPLSGIVKIEKSFAQFSDLKLRACMPFIGWGVACVICLILWASLPNIDRQVRSAECITMLIFIAIAIILALLKAHKMTKRFSQHEVVIPYDNALLIQDTHDNTGLLIFDIESIASQKKDYTITGKVWRVDTKERGDILELAPRDYEYTGELCDVRLPKCFKIGEKLWVEPEKADNEKSNTEEIGGEQE